MKEREQSRYFLVPAEALVRRRQDDDSLEKNQRGLRTSEVADCLARKIACFRCAAGCQ